MAKNVAISDLAQANFFYYPASDLKWLWWLTLNRIVKSIALALERGCLLHITIPIPELNDVPQPTWFLLNS